MSQERIYCLAWSRVSGVGPILVDRLIQHFGSLEAAWTADDRALLAIDGIGELSIVKIMESRAQIDPQQLSATHAIENPLWWARTDADYPRLLAEIPSAPSMLYYRGQVALAENRGEVPTIAIVGTRSPSEYGKKWARKIATLLAQNGFTVVSGLALGIDAEAHSACLEAGGRTIAVIGTGLDIVYPPHHHQLAAAIAQQGLIVSEYVAATPPDRSHFPARNRIIAGLSRVTIVIDAPTKSGALITAYQANDFGRDVYVLPGSIDNPNSLGGLGLLTRGAQPILSLAHLLELLATIPQLDPHRQLDMFADRQPDLDPSTTRSIAPTAPSIAVEIELQPVWQLVTDLPISFDELVTSSQLPVATVSSILLQLELLGLVTQLPGMRYQR
ncbi:DNA-processing protein DprA [Chamaesiphon sp. VAR_69_metabat_338]|uniref:DNA-processing protein DprA n=1 Tax=Chamaesiphon sp. VAR_69_metabat_338 TaxID=2964704 RepID=UPI00286E6378|nr:DNA-processing protein DprA [Chamaesiphon sp. VAR_69_metabat_338]